MVSAPPSGPIAPDDSSQVAAVHGPLSTGAERATAAPLLDGRQIFFLFVGTALAACLIFALGVTVGRRIEQHAAAQKKAEPADPLAVLDEIANAEEALTFHRTVLDRGVPLPAGEAARPSRYTLNSAPYAQRPAAEDLLRRLREAGYKAKLVETSGQGAGQNSGAGQRPAFRLQLGDYASADAAQPVRAEILSRFGLATTVGKLVVTEDRDR